MSGIGDLPVPIYGSPIEPLPESGGGSSEPAPSGGGEVLFQLDRNTIEELLAMLPKTWMDPIVANNNVDNFSSKIGLGALLLTDRGNNQYMGIAEGSVILSMLDNWIKSDEKLAEAFRESIKKQDISPLSGALKAYVQSREIISKTVAEGAVIAGINATGKTIATNMTPGVEDTEGVSAAQGNAGVVRTDVFQTLQFLRGSPLILASLKSVDPELLAKAYHTAEGEIVTNLLANVADAQAKQGETIKESIKKMELNQTSQKTSNNTQQKPLTDSLEIESSLIPSQVLTNYLQDVQAGKDTLNPLAVSLAITGVIGGSEARVPLTMDDKGEVSLDLTKDSVLAFGAPVIAGFVGLLGNSLDSALPSIPSNVQNQITVTFSQIALDVNIAAAYWAIPGALTLNASTPSEGGKGPTKAAVLSYAQTIAEFVSRPEFTDFVRNRLIIAGGEHVTKEHVEKYVAMFKTVLLATALAGLDKALTGGVIIRAEDFLDLISGKTALESGDFRTVLVKLIREQLGYLDPKDRVAILGSLVRYFSSNPKLEQLIDPTKSFLILSDTNLHRKSSLEQRG